MAKPSYIPPQVIVNGKVDYQGTTEYVQPSVVALVTKVDSYLSRETSRVLGNGATAVINVKNLVESSVKLKDYSGKTLVKDTDYTLAVDKANATFSVTVINKDIKTQALLISYEYIPDDFFEPLKWFTLASIASYYGAAYNDDNSIKTPMTAAADFAFRNGASTICIIPVYEPADKSLPSQTIDEALDKLKLHEDIAIVVPIGFTAAELTNVRDHIRWCEEHQLERRGIFGLDGTKTTYTVADLTQIASTLDSEFIMFIPNTIAPVYVTDSRNSVNLPGWLYAAAVAGVAMATPIDLSLTRHVVTGFYGTQSYLYEEKNTLAQAGCCVIEMINGQLKIRHSVVTKQSQLLDWTFGGIYNYLMGAIRTELDPYIGKPSTDVLVSEIDADVNLFLTKQKEINYLYDFDSLEVSRRQSNPEIIDVTFRCSIIRPTLWIYVTFYVDLTY